jgi:hypothetical protein
MGSVLSSSHPRILQKVAELEHEHEPVPVHELVLMLKLAIAIPPIKLPQSAINFSAKLGFQVRATTINY